MKPFDERFADSVREVFDAYHEEVDPAALARLEQSLKGRAARFPGWVRMVAGLVLALGVLAVIGYYGLDWREGGAKGGDVASESVTNGAVIPESTVSGGSAPSGSALESTIRNDAVVPNETLTSGAFPAVSVPGETVTSSAVPNDAVTDAPPDSPDHVTQLYAAQDDSLHESLHPENDRAQNLHPVPTDT
ncbi:MAG: hypothetical protein LAT52_10855, partial [Balneolales bacterium]|nr:hypothetical protein [Balneolales bacterium]